jgi:hypothetical protein
MVRRTTYAHAKTEEALQHCTRFVDAGGMNINAGKSVYDEPC